jgi:ubiquitin carboxyl-terminal hydrolase 5/13
MRYQYDAEWKPVKIKTDLEIQDKLAIFSENWELPQELGTSDLSSAGMPSDYKALGESMGFSEADGEAAYKRLSERLGSSEAITVEMWMNEVLEPSIQEAAQDTEDLLMKIGIVMSMGFEEEQARDALKRTDNDTERAVDYLLSRSQGSAKECRNEGAIYTVGAFIAHKGASVHCGHYVACVRKEMGSSEFVLLNDDKVSTVSSAVMKELLANAYVVFLVQQ